MPVKMTTKEKVLGIITRRGSTGKSPLLQGSKASSDELKAILRDLEKEGTIKAWPYRSRAGELAIYTLPDARDPRTPEMLAGAERKTKKKAAPTTREPVVRNRKSAAPSNGSGAIAAVISDLEAKRTAALDRVEQIDTAIATLRALA